MLASQTPRIQRNKKAQREPAIGLSTLTFFTRLGWIGVSGRNSGVVGMSIGHTRQTAAQRAIDRKSCESGPPPMDPEFDPFEVTEWLEVLAARIDAYAQGEPDDFRDVLVEHQALTRFQRKVLSACRAIPYGQTASYAELAARCGSPGAARAVGNIMARNRVPLIIPCHRVLNSSGELGGFSAPGGVTTKRKLLDLERHVDAD